MHEANYLQLMYQTDYRNTEEVFVDRDPLHFGFLSQVIRDPFTKFDVVIGHWLYKHNQ